MPKNKTDDKQRDFNVQIKSKIHPNVCHTIQINLHCYERMPKEKGNNQKEEDLFCYERMPCEKTIIKYNTNNFHSQK